MIFLNNKVTFYSFYLTQLKRIKVHQYIWQLPNTPLAQILQKRFLLYNLHRN